MSSLPLANQVRQLYVVTGIADALPATLGQFIVKGVQGNFFYLQHFGHGGLTASDKIDVNKIRYIKITQNNSLRDKLTAHTVTVSTVVPGQVYEIKLLVHNYIGQGAYDYQYRLGLYKAKSGDDAAAIAAGLAADLQAALGLEKGADPTAIANYKEPICTVTVSGAAITITEVEQYWELGRFPVAQMPVEVVLNGIVNNDDETVFNWATITKAVTTVENVGKKLADLEYSLMGKRGDIYRNIGWPRSLTTKYMIDPTAKYDVLDIHYFFKGQGNSVQQSEKELTIAVPTPGDVTASEVAAEIMNFIGEEPVLIAAPENYTPRG